MTIVEPIIQVDVACGRSNAANAKVEIDNSQMGKTLSICYAGTEEPRVSIEFKVNDQSIREDVEYQKSAGRINISVVDLLMTLPPNSEGKLVIGNGRTQKTIVIQRKGLLADRYKDLAPLYRQMAADVKKQGFFLVTIPVVLWDASFTGEGFDRTGKRRFWADGSDPDNNLNWGGVTGIISQLEENGWKQVYKDSPGNTPLRKAIYAKQVTPTTFWKRQGVTKPFTVYLTAIAYDYRDIGYGYQKFTDLVTGNEPESVTLTDGRTIDLGDSRVVGLGTHFIPEGRKIIGSQLSAPTPKGLFIASCFGAENFGPLLVRNNLYPLLLSIPQTSSEGYIYLPLIEGLLKGEGLKGLLADVAESYSNFHPGVFPGEKQYVNPGTDNFESVISRQNVDWDGDLLVNAFDPEPEWSNPIILNRENGWLWVGLSNGWFIQMNLTQNQISRFIKAK